MHLLKGYFKYINDPNETLPRLLEQRSFAQACCGYWLAAIGWVVFFNAGDGISIASLLLKILFVFLAEVTAGYFIAALTALFLDFKKVPLSSAELFVLVGLSGWMKGFLIMGAIFSLMFPQAELGLCAPLFVLVVFLAQLIFLTRSVARVGETSIGVAFLAWVLGVLPIGVLFALVGGFMLWGIILLV